MLPFLASKHCVLLYVPLNEPSMLTFWNVIFFFAYFNSIVHTDFGIYFSIFVQAAGSSIAVVVSLYDLVKNCEEMERNNYVTNANQSLRDAARTSKEDKKTLKKKLDALLYDHNFCYKFYNCIYFPGCLKWKQNFKIKL